MSFSIPVVLLAFKRPEQTARVLEVIRQARPTSLFIVADGPRPEVNGEAAACAAVRHLLDQKIDWDCEVRRNYAEVNLGCARRVSSGLDWVFEHVEEAIVLEDDCLPHPTFFSFCAELLDRYRHDTRVAVISGQNVQFGRKYSEYSYYFSRYPHCWGWATWKRAWRYFDYDMTLWPRVRDTDLLEQILETPEMAQRWTRRFQDACDGRIDSWATRWTLACWLQNMLSVLPAVNLVTNIGFDTCGTNATNSRSRFANIPAEPIQFPLQHPPMVVRNAPADAFTDRTLFKPGPLLRLKLQVRRGLDRVNEAIASSS